MQIYDHLIKDHESVKKLLNDLVSLDDAAHERRDELVEEIRKALIPHSRAEEAVFYNSLRSIASERKMDDDREKVMHGFGEHMEAEGLLRLLQVRDSVNLDWKPTAKKLKEAIEHHIREEEDELFTLGRKLLTEDDAQKIGSAFAALKPKIEGEGFMRTTFDLVANLMPPKLVKSFRGETQGRDLHH